MTRTTLGTTTFLAALVITAGGCIIQNEPVTEQPIDRPGYGLIPFTLPHESVGITLDQEVATVRTRQEELRAATAAYEQAYEEGTAAIRAERARTRHAGLRRAQQQLLTALAREHQAALRRAETAQERMNVALAQAQDALHAQNTLRVATALDDEQQQLAKLTRRVTDAAGYLNDQTRRLRHSMIDNVRRRKS